MNTLGRLQIQLATTRQLAKEVSLMLADNHHDSENCRFNGAAEAAEKDIDCFACLAQEKLAEIWNGTEVTVSGATRIERIIQMPTIIFRGIKTNISQEVLDEYGLSDGDTIVSQELFNNVINAEGDRLMREARNSPVVRKIIEDRTLRRDIEKDNGKDEGGGKDEGEED